MSLDDNPFEYEAANNLSDDLILEYYVDDFNYSRFIQSKRNVFLFGERGSGKTMAFLYNSFAIQRKLVERNQEKEVRPSTLGVYIPCNTHLIHKPEYQLHEEHLAQVISEHYLVLAMTYYVADALCGIPNILADVDEPALYSELNFVLGGSLPEGTDPLNSIRMFIRRELLNTQRSLNRPEADAFHYNTFSFGSMFVPFLTTCSEKIPYLSDRHFLLMLDDAQELNSYQIRILNSWISHRDHSLFSFKIAIARVSSHTMKTASGGTLLEGHDYTRVDLEARLENRHSDFFKFAKELIEKRLHRAGVSTVPEDFFPLNNRMHEGLKAARTLVEQKAKADGKRGKALQDHVYKYGRVEYFRGRDPKSNRPPYSGFETLVFLSTGVVRNLLEPCFRMFDAARSELESAATGHKAAVERIEPRIQTKEILKLSEDKWDWLRDGIARDIEGCSTEEGGRVYKLLDALAILFRNRLMNHRSEPSALSFTISGQDSSVMSDLNRLVTILRKAQLLYVRSGPAKDRGRREPYYEPNRMLWPIRALDPHGQHARVSITAQALLTASATGRLDDDPRSSALFWEEE